MESKAGNEWQIEWSELQENWRPRLSFETPPELVRRLQDPAGGLKVGGVDLSFVEGDDKSACAAYVVMKCQRSAETSGNTKKKKSKFSPESNFEVLYEDLRMVNLEGPYIPGFLAFREAGPIVEMVKDQRLNKPEVTPDVLIVDGNGLLHPRKFGLACHVGLMLDIPTIGVAKNLLFLQHQSDEVSHSTSENRILHRKECHDKLKAQGDYFAILASDGTNETLGIALRTSKEAGNPVYVSPGHKISLESCKEVVLQCSSYRIPEPTRQADIRSREFIRKSVGVASSTSSCSQ